MRKLVGVVAAVLVLSVAGCGLSGDENARREEHPSKNSFAIEGPPILGLREELKARLPTEADQFGVALAASGSTLLVGGSEEAHVFVRGSSGYMNFQQRLFTDEGYPASLYSFGTSVALFGDTALVGCPACRAGRGAAFVFVRSNEVWSQQQVLTANDASDGASFGRAVALDANQALITAAGGAYVFDRSGAAWEQQAKLELEEFAVAAAISGDEVAVVAGASAGSLGSVAYAFTRSAGVWSAKIELARTSYLSQVAFSADELIVTYAGRELLVGGPLHGGFAAFKRPLKAIDLIPPEPPAMPEPVSWAHGGPGLGLFGDEMFLGSDVADPGTGGTLYKKERDLWVETAEASALDRPNVVAMGEKFVALGYGYSTTWQSGKVTVLTRYREPQLACKVNSECVSGHCVDGVCCDTACAGDPCRSCLAAVKGQGSDGVCDWIAPETKTSCGENKCGSVYPFMLEPYPVVQSFECKGPSGCVASTAAVCGPYTCTPQTVTCKDHCETTADCYYSTMFGALCINNRCIEKGEPGYPSTGGRPSTGGTGGSAAGGSATGGGPTGGSSVGGADTGAGGTTVGGAGNAEGGESVGGDSVGGEPSGGSGEPSGGGSNVSTGGSAGGSAANGGSTGGAQASGASSGGTRASESGGRASGGQRPNIGVRTSPGGKAEPKTAGGCSVSAARAASARDFGSLASAAALCFLARRRRLSNLRSAHRRRSLSPARAPIENEPQARCR